MSTPSTDLAKIEWFLTHGVERVFPNQDELRAKLLSGKRLAVYWGMDATGKLHMGHALNLRKMRELQDLGHRIVILVGTFTSLIGDPTDKGAVRKQQTPEEVAAHAKNYVELVGKFVRLEGENAAEIRYNADWLAGMTFADVIRLASNFTVQQMLERDMFQKRIAEDKPIYLHEFFYPLMQGYDSVVLDVDLEIGGNDQTFNMLAGRDLMKALAGKEKMVLATRLLTDETGKKMGKTDGNGVNLDDRPEDVYGKVMRWTDPMIVPGFELCTDMPAAEVAEVRARLQSGENPMVLKKDLAYRITAWIHGADEAEKAAEHFASVHQQGELPEEIIEITREAGEVALLDVLVEANLVPSKSEARRQVEQNAVKVNGEVVSDVKAMVQVTKDGVLLQKGKRSFAKVVAR